MSDSDTDKQLDGLPLPSPRSPRHLDEKILNYAREHAPAPGPSRRAAWPAGLAAVAIAGVAVLITVQQPGAPDMDKAAPEMTAPAEAPGQHPPAPFAAEANLEQRATIKMSRRLPASEQAPPASAEFAGATSGSALLASDDGSTADTEQAEEAVALAAAPRAEADVRTVLVQCQQWLEEGQRERALAAYADLHRSCSDCGLPDTLEEALEELEDMLPAHQENLP